MPSNGEPEVSMTSSKPYLLRAFYEWICDNECTPYLVVNADYPSVRVPMQYVEDGKIVLNVAPMAVKNVFMDNEGVSFGARFSGKSLDVFVPIAAVLAIYARENGRGMVFGEDEDDLGAVASPSDSDAKSAKTPLSEVSSASSPAMLSAAPSPEVTPLATTGDETDSDDDGSGGGSGKKGKKPSLRIVK